MHENEKIITTVKTKENIFYYDINTIDTMNLSENLRVDKELFSGEQSLYENINFTNISNEDINYEMCTKI